MKKLILNFVFVFGLSHMLLAQCTTSVSVNYSSANRCVGDVVSLDCNTFNATYLWKCPNGNCPPGFDITSQFQNIISTSTDYNGIYSVTVTDVNNCVSTAQAMIQINPKPEVVVGGKQVYCENEPYDIAASVTNDPNGIYGPYTYLWSNGQTTRNLIGTSGGGVFGPAPSCFVTNGFGCTEANTSNFFIVGNAKPQVTITATGTTKCEGKTSTLTANVTMGSSPYTYEWYFNNKSNPNGGILATSVAGVTGAYKVKVTDSNGCLSFSNTKNITMQPGPIAKITAESSTTFCNGGSVKLFASTNPGYTFAWKKGANFISGANADNYIASASGNYTVKITDANGCSRISAITPVIINCRLSGQLLNDSEMNKQVKAYPVPATDFVNIDPSGMKGIGTIDIQNEMGQTVYQKDVNFDGFTIQQVDLTGFKTGLYIISLRNSESVQKVSIIKE